MIGQSLLNRIQHRELVTPYLDLSLTSENWPESYLVKVDSSGWSGEGDTYFHPSSHAVLAERLLYYKITGQTQQEKKTINSAMTLSVGTAMHAVVETQLVMAGLCRSEDVEVPIVNHEQTYRGHVDAVVTHPNGNTYVCDIKTTYSGKFQRLKEAPLEWVMQVGLYIDALQKSGRDVSDEGIILAIEIGWPYGIKEYRVKKDNDMLQSVYEKWERVRKAVEAGKPPFEKCCALGSATMKACPARDFCKPEWDLK